MSSDLAEGAAAVICCHCEPIRKMYLYYFFTDNLKKSWNFCSVIGLSSLKNLLTVHSLVIRSAEKAVFIRIFQEFKFQVGKANGFRFIDKGGLPSESFHFVSNLQSMMPNHNPEHYPSKGLFNSYVDKMRGEGVKKCLFLSTLRV